MNRLAITSLAALTLAATATTAAAQTLDARIRAASSPRVQFEFASRAGVCGDGISFLSSGTSYYGNVNVVNGVSSQPCAAGPVRVVVDRADGMITSIQTVAGPLHPADGAQDLGTVSPRDAFDYLLAVAGREDGRAGRDAILPAGLAEGVDVVPGFTSIALNQARAADTRHAALSWLARDDDGSPARTRAADDLLLRIARDENETQPMRRQALSLLAYFGRGAGIPSLIQLASAGSPSWVADESLRALSRSTDPRARDFLRKQLRRTDITDAQMATIVRGLGGSEATGQDIDLLRSSFASMAGEGTKGAIMEVMAQRGTAADLQWLLGVARDSHEAPGTRRRALDMVGRTSSGNAQILGLYDTMDDESLKEALIRLYAQNNDRASLDKLIAIARTDSSYTLRRRAIASLSRTQDARARQALLEISTK